MATLNDSESVTLSEIDSEEDEDIYFLFDDTDNRVDLQNIDEIKWISHNDCVNFPMNFL